ncbi:hypothetical protein MON38_02000 [Hymenobacter sp. DH14]|uniref:LemA family protein n=1 Tax=Hymenobacter cyanobacteriorum TaxID=2926463 RepID=A0A9X2AGD3_9BACT|nr:hypothetical protein [Hymenobacter cyanobacteriorum]MCI1186175.1 hypothetical protein [Hymenobacter cyanobacteriorum]
MKTVGLGLILLLGMAASCKRDGAKTVAVNPASAAASKLQLDALRDSVDVKWRNMVESDDQKLALTRLLLRELHGQPGRSEAQLKALEQANARLKARRYDQATMSSSALIDQYDTAQDSLLNALYPVAAPNGGAPTENARNFVEGIQQLDAGVVGFRVIYDDAAKRYNNYLQLHGEELQSLGGKYVDLKPLPLFTIGAKP